MHLINEIYIKFIKNLTINKIKYIFLIFLLSPFLIMIVIIKPILLVRFGYFDIQRIGMISHAEHYLLHENNKKRKVKTFDIWVIDGDDYNKQFYVLLKRKFLIISELSIFYKVLRLISKYIKIYSKHIIVLYPGTARIDRSSIQLNLTKEEINSGEPILKKFGIPSNSKIICFTCRDNLYLKKKYPSKNFSYHDYRDINIKNYIPAIKALIKKDFYVVRMGRVARKKLNIKSKQFIDYPFHPLKSDFMDFFFAHKCYFWIGGHAGIDNVAVTFRKPFLDLNMAPIANLKIASKKTILCLKIHKNHNGKKLSLTEIFSSGLVKSNCSEEFRRKKIKLEELKGYQIKDIVLEMIKLMKNSWKIKGKNDLRLQKKFRKLFLSKINQIDPKFRYKFNALYSLSFLRKNSWFLK
jgi:putative glycosyltransferase (TIGR04372 family)